MRSCNYVVVYLCDYNTCYESYTFMFTQPPDRTTANLLYRATARLCDHTIA